jgi:hypothetical protein
MRSTRRGYLEPELCPTPKSDGGGNFTAMTQPEETANIKLVRPSMDLQQVSSTAAKWVPAWQLSDDGETWDASTTLPRLFQTSTIDKKNVEGIYFSGASGNAFEDVSSNMNKRFCRWGVWGVNTAGQSAAELAQVAIRIEKKPC